MWCIRWISFERCCTSSRASEQYPDLKANQNFLSLQSQLKRAEENRIAVARRDYIEANRQPLKSNVPMLCAMAWCGAAP
jgi:hypothetical protein